MLIPFLRDGSLVNDHDFERFFLFKAAQEGQPEWCEENENDDANNNLLRSHGKKEIEEEDTPCQHAAGSANRFESRGITDTICGK